MFKKTRRSKKSGVILLFFIVFLPIAIIAFGIFYKNIFSRKPPFISPVAIQGEQILDKLKNRLMKNSIMFSEIAASGSSFFVFLENGGQIILPANNDNIEPKIYSLQLILKRFTIEGKKFKQIDFRFDKPTILF